MALLKDFSKVSPYNLYIIELPFHSESNGVIFNFVHLSNYKLWPYN